MVSAMNWVQQWTVMFNSGFRCIWKLIWISLHQLEWVTRFFLTKLVCLKALKFFLPVLRQHHILVHSDNHQGDETWSGGLTHLRLHWQQLTCQDCTRMHEIHPGEWHLHQMWEKFGRVQMNFFLPMANLIIIDCGSQWQCTNTSNGSKFVFVPLIFCAS